MKLQNIITVLTLILLISCNGRHESVIIERIPEPSIKTTVCDSIFCLNIKGQPLKHDFMTSVIDSIEIIRLETTEESIIGRIGSVNVLNDYLIIADDMASGDVLAFDKTGRYSHKIGSYGEGPEEYASIGQVFVHDNQIYVYDRSHSKLITYDVLGNHINSMSLTPISSPSKIYAVNQNTYIGTHTGYFKRNPFEIVFISSSDSITGNALPFKYTRPKIAGEVVNDCSGRTLFYTVMSDTIYSIIDSEITAVGLFGLYEDNEVKDYMEKTAYMDKTEYRNSLFGLSDNEIVNHISLTVLSNYWLVNWQTQKGAYISVINPTNYKSENYIRTDRLSKSCDFPFVIVGSDGDSFFSSLDESFFSLNDENIRKISNIFEQKCNQHLINLDFENSNPLLIKFTLKNKDI